MEPHNKLLVPIAIIVAGVLIAGALFFANRDTSIVATDDDGDSAESSSFFVPVSASDHILGNPEAKIAMIEYSDLECPACKAFHATAHSIIDKYGAEGDVAWVYRHFPLAQLHPKAVEEAVASECASELGGNDSFWQYVDRIFEITPSNNGLNLALLNTTADELGLDRDEFESCVDEKDREDAVRQSYEDALKSGGTGTPFIIFAPKSGVNADTIGIVTSVRNQLNLRPETLAVAEDGSHIRMVGALDISVLDLLISSMLGESDIEEIDDTNTEQPGADTDEADSNPASDE
jgi:protein-disulfide isomerase